MKQPVSRRKFLEATGLATVATTGMALLGSASTNAKAKTGKAEPSLNVPPTSDRIVDMHVHFQASNAEFMNDLLKLCDRLNFTAVLHTPFEHRKAVADAAKQHPTQIIPSGALELDDPKVVDKTKELHDLGYRGLGEISSMLKNCNDDSYFPVYDLANSYGWFLMFHTGIVMRESFDKPANVGSGRMHPMYLDNIGRRCPQVTVLGAHCGNPEYTWAAEVARWNPNVFFDLSGTTLAKFHSRYAEFKNYFWWADDEWEAQPGDDSNPFCKLVFGSDTGLHNIENVLARYHSVFQACDVPEKTRKSVLGGTLAKKLGIPV